MKRPAFQFYPADWRKNAKLRRCSPAARGVWMDILGLLHDSDEYGILRWPLKDIIQAAGASKAHVRELVDKGVLKGADHDAEAYVYRPTHAGKLGEAVILVTADGGPVWYSSRFVRDELIRQRRGASTRFDGDNRPPSRTPNEPPKPTIGERHGDGPSSTSSSSYSEANASAAAGAPPDVDKSTNTKTEVRAQAREWLETHGLTAGEAKAFLNTVAKDHPAVVAEAFQEAIKTVPIGEAKAFVLGIAKRLAGQRTAPKTVPSDEAERSRAYLDSQTGRGTPPTPEQAEALRKVREDALGKVAA